MKPAEIVDRLVKSPKGVTSERIDRALNAMVRSHRRPTEIADTLEILRVSHGLTITSNDVESSWQRRIAGIQTARAKMAAQPESKERDLMLTYFDATLSYETARLEQWRQEQV